MVVFVVIIIVAVIGYFIYQSLPNTKYEKSQNLFNAKDYLLAINILNDIFDKHNDAPAKLAECKLKLGQQAANKSEKVKYFNEIIALRKRINNSVSIDKFEIFEAKAFFEIAKIQFEETKGGIDKLNQNIRFIDNANKKGCESEFNTLKIRHFNELAEIYFKNAVEKEMAGKISTNKNVEAVQTYATAKDYALKANNTTILYNSAVRIVICRLKLNENIDLNSISEIQKSNADYQKELYYRYVIYLLKKKKFSEAEKIILTKLNFQSSDIDKLKEILNTEKCNNVVEKIVVLNTSIEKLYNNSLSIEDLENLYDDIDEIISEVRVIDTQLSEKITNIKLTLFSRLLSYYISEEQFEEAIGIIQKYPMFWENVEMLKNLGICCYGLASKGLLNENNYKTVISGWLTAVFSDKVILKSLNDTSWDDDYTFTLTDSIGSNYSQHEELPDNVNYDEVSESNISIGATQKELIQQFETIIHKSIQDTTLSKLVNDFYDKEKEALEKIIEIIENDILFSTPYFAITYDLNNEIIEELDNDYDNYSNENALQAGIPYIKNSNATVVYQYFYANDLLDRVKSAVNSNNSDAIKKLNTQDNKQWIEKFENISDAVEDNLFNSISAQISQNDENEKLIAVMEECISFSKSSDKLKYQYSNYVSNYCITKVNNEEIDNFKALSLMKGAYLRSPQNPRVCKNFITLVRFNLMDILNDRTRKTTEIYNILDWIKNNMSQTYKQNSNELSNARKEILQQLRQSGVDISLFDDNNPLSRLNLNYGQSLNAQGLKMKRVLTYLKQLGNEQESDTLERLRQQLGI